MPTLPDDLERVLLDEASITERVNELADDLNDDYAQVDSLILVGVLKGAFIFLADLVRRLAIPHHVDFVALSSYNDDVISGGAVRMIMDTRTPVTGRHVLLVEDILDTGCTLDYLTRSFMARSPASLKACVLLRKPDRKKVDVQVDYIGFDIPDAWVVGYGLDYADRYRTLPYIAILNPEVYQG